MGEQLVWRSIQDNQWEGIYPGGKPLYCIHDQNMLLRRANEQCWKPTILLRHKTYGNRRALKKNCSFVPRTFHRITEQIFLRDSVRKPKYSYPETTVSRGITVIGFQ